MKVIHRLVTSKNDMGMWHMNHNVRRDACQNVTSVVLCNNIQVNVLNVFILNTFDIILVYFSTVYKTALFRNILFLMRLSSANGATI